MGKKDDSPGWTPDHIRPVPDAHSKNNPAGWCCSMFLVVPMAMALALLVKGLRK
jgi:hypothetical protein